MDKEKIGQAKDLISIQSEISTRLSSFITETALRREGLELDDIDRLERQLIGVLETKFRFLRSRIKENSLVVGDKTDEE